MFYFSTHPPLAFQMKQHFLKHGVVGKVTWAVIAPAKDPGVERLVISFNKQLVEKHHWRPVTWVVRTNNEHAENELLENLGIQGAVDESAPYRKPQNPAALSASAKSIIDAALRFARLRGLLEISVGLVTDLALRAVRNHRIYSRGTARFQILNAHGAKNQEFDHVIVFWGHKKTPDIEQQRRLLYNAVSRATKTCIALAQGDRKKIEGDQVLRLLGPARPAISPNPRKKQT